MGDGLEGALLLFGRDSGCGYSSDETGQLQHQFQDRVRFILRGHNHGIEFLYQSFSLLDDLVWRERVVIVGLFESSDLSADPGNRTGPVRGEDAKFAGVLVAGLTSPPSFRSAGGGGTIAAFTFGIGGRGFGKGTGTEIGSVGRFCNEHVDDSKTNVLKIQGKLE